MLIISLAALAAGQALTKSVEVPITLAEDAIVVDATVNGSKCSFMFDTGFSGSVILDPSIDIGKATGQMTLRDFVGQFTAPTVKLKSLSIGSMKVDSSEMEAVQLSQGNMSENYNAHCDGIMGFEAVSQYVFEINFEHSKFIFHPSTVDITKRVPDNKRTFLTKLLPKGHNSLEMLVDHEKGGQFVLALDTGNAFYATTHKDVLVREGLWKLEDEPKFCKSSFVASGETKSFYYYMKDAKIFGVPVKESVWDIIDAASSQADHDGTVGFGFLKNFNIIIDNKRRRVWFEQFRAPESELTGDIGATVYENPVTKRITVYKVTPEGPAALAGVKAGDQILEVDGKEPLNMNPREVYRMFVGKSGDSVKLAVSRSGNLMNFTVVRKNLINNLPK